MGSVINGVGVIFSIWNSRIVKFTPTPFFLAAGCSLVGLVWCICGESADMPIVVLKRDGGLSACPIFEVRIYSDGSIQYQGGKGTVVTGKRSAKLTSESMQKLDQEFVDMKFFALRELKAEEPRTITRSYDCVKDAEFISTYPTLQKECEERKTVALTATLQIEDSGYSLGYSKSNRSNNVRASWVPVEEMKRVGHLIEFVKKLTGADKWIGKGSC